MASPQNYDRVTALRDLNGYDLAAQVNSVNFMLSVASNRDIVGILVDHMFDSYDHDQEAIKKRQKTGKKYFREVSEKIMSGLLGAASPLGPDEKSKIAEDIVSGHGDPHLKMWACSFLASKDPDPVNLSQIEEMLSPQKDVSPECDAVDLARFIWEGHEARNKEEEAIALVSLLLKTRPDMAEQVKYCLCIPTYVPRLKNPKMAFWALEKLIVEHPGNRDTYLARQMPLAMHANPSILMGVNDIPASLLKSLSESSKKLSAEEHAEYARQMMSLLFERALRTTNSKEAIETIDALPVEEASSYVSALGSRPEDFPKDELKRVVMHRMMSDPKSVQKAMDTIVAEPSIYVQEATLLLVDDKYVAYRETAVKNLIPVISAFASKEYVVGIIGLLPDNLRPSAVALASKSGRIWTPNEMAHMLETEDENTSEALKEVMLGHGLGSLVPYDLAERRSRRFVRMPVYEREL